MNTKLPNDIGDYIKYSKLDEPTIRLLSRCKSEIERLDTTITQLQDLVNSRTSAIENLRSLYANQAMKMETLKNAR